MFLVTDLVREEKIASKFIFAGDLDESKGFDLLTRTDNYCVLRYLTLQHLFSNTFKRYTHKTITKINYAVYYLTKLYCH